MKQTMTGEIIPLQGMLIGIGGVSRSGKSTLASGIAGMFPFADPVIICQDDYIHSPAKLPEINRHIDWEDPASLDFPKIREVVSAVIASNKLVVMEGLFAFQDEALNRMMHIGFYIHLPRRAFFSRKRADLRWGPEPEWYIRHIWRSHCRFGRSIQGVETLIRLDGRQPFDMEEIAGHIRGIL